MNECLNRHWFRSLDEAINIVDASGYQYNHVRPHRSLNYLTPVVFAEQAA
ncbi:MAG: transposase [Gammaproteobacteria bacterium]|nr:transposase [Gammaproteobacteria bacterium]